MAFRQRAARHLRRLGDAHHVEDCGGHVAQRAVPQGDRRLLRRIQQQEGDQIGGVGAVRLAGGGVELFDVPVVSGDSHHIVLRQRGLYHGTQMAAHVAAGLQLGGGVLGVADHVAVGEVGDNEVVLPQRPGHGLRHLGQGQLRLLVEVDALGRGDTHIILTGEGTILAPVEEKGDMCEFFRLRTVELGLSGL